MVQNSDEVSEQMSLKEQADRADDAEISRGRIAASHSARAQWKERGDKGMLRSRIVDNDPHAVTARRISENARDTKGR